MKRLATLLQIRPGEAALVTLVAALFMLIEAGRGLGANTADALFFRRFGVDNLPYMFMLLGAVNFTVSLTYAASLGKFDKRRFFVTLLLALAGVLLVERAALAFNVIAFYPVLWITVNMISSMLGLLSWNVAGEVCDARQAKRLFSIFVSAGILGGVIGNFLTGPIAQVLGTENALIVYAALLLGASLVARRVIRQHFKPIRRRGLPASFLDEVRAGYDYVRRSAMFKTMAVGSVLFSILYFSISFPFSQAVSAAFPTEAEVAGFLGVFSGLATAITFGVSLLLANRLYARIGVVNAVLLLPIAYLIGFSLFAASFSLVTAAMARLLQLITLNGIAGTAYSTFFNVVPADRRAQVLSFDSGVPEQIGVALSGVLLVLGERVLAPMQIFIMGMSVAAACGVLVWQLKRHYGAALLAALRAGRHEVFTAGERNFTRFQGDANAMRVAAAALHDPKPATRRIALEILTNIQSQSAVADVVPCLRDPEADVRAAALRALGGLTARREVGSIVAVLDDPDARVRTTALRVLPELQPVATPGLIGTLEQRLRDPEVSVQTAAAVALAKFGQSSRCLPRLAGLVHSPQSTTRAAALEALGEIAVIQLADEVDVGFESGAVVDALRDQSANVRRAACRALAQMGAIGAIGPLTDRLSDPDPAVRRIAALALRAFGPEATSHSLNVLQHGDALAQMAALDALELDDLASLQIVHDYCHEQLVQLRRWGELRAALPPGRRATKLLRQELQARCVVTERRLIKALALIIGHETMALVSKGLRSHDAESRAAAIEALDTLADRPLARQIVPLLETNGDAPRQAADWAVTELLASTDHWLRALTARALSEIDVAGLRSTLRALSNDDDAWVKEAARAAWIELNGEKEMETLATMSVMDRLLLLHDVPLFAALSSEDLKQIADIAREQWHDDGAAICREGEEGDELFVLAAGQVQVTKRSNGQEKLLAIRRAGDFFGEMSIIEAVPRWATVRADGEVRTLVIDGESFKTILRDRPEVALAVLRDMMKRLRERE
jgi:HEAT repeat protein